VYPLCAAFADAQMPGFRGTEGFGRHAAGRCGGAIIQMAYLSDVSHSSLHVRAEDRTRPRAGIFDINGAVEVSSTIREAGGSDPW